MEAVPNCNEAPVRASSSPVRRTAAIEEEKDQSVQEGDGPVLAG